MIPLPTTPTTGRFYATAWKNGSPRSTGSGYGLKLAPGDRDQFFDRSWSAIHLELDGWPTTADVNVAKASFWNGTCRELIQKEIGAWMLANDLAPWPEGSPPKIPMEPIGDARFRVCLPG